MTLAANPPAASGNTPAWRRVLPLPPGGAVESALLLLLACCISLGQGQDRNWDLLNYHLYNAFSFVDGRFAHDLYPVGIQTYFSPLLDVPYYLLAVQLLPGLPRVVACLAGVPFGLLIVVVLRIARIALPAATPAEAWLAPIATAIGVSGTATWSEIGTTYGDIQVSALALAGLLAPLSLLPRRATMRRGAWNRAMLVAGVLIGCAAGLKPTACILAPGALVALTLTAGGTRRAWTGAVVFCFGWAAGFALVYGWWGWLLYRRFGNPLFPLFNHVFASPWVPTDNGSDTRFMPRDAVQALFYPFFWLRGRAFVVAEVEVRDPRFALAYVAIAALAIGGLVRRVPGAHRRAGVTPQPVAVAICIFVAVSYVAWEVLFSILRYALGLEVLTGIIIILGLRAAVASGPAADFAARRLPVACAIVLVALVAVSSRPGWGRLRHYGTSVFDIHAPAIPDDATIILAAKPIGFAAPFLRGKDIAFVGIAEVPRAGLLRDEILRRVRHAAPALVLIDKPPAYYAALLRSYGRQIDPAACQPVGNEFDRGLTLCGTRLADGA
ncbi:MAG: hypothetical protein ABSC95_07965 [Acetobacteraceae bacterium]|jgi:hypothetical protein